MPVDYKKWERLLEEERETIRWGAPDDLDWSEMTAEERQKYREEEDEMEEQLQKKRAEHEEDLKRHAEDRDISWLPADWNFKTKTKYEFNVARVQLDLKLRGNREYEAGDLKEAETTWFNCLDILDDCGLDTPGAKEAWCSIKCNLAQMYIRLKKWDAVKDLTTSVLEFDPRYQKALYRRALAHEHFCDWKEAEKDLTNLLRLNPRNQHAAEMLKSIHTKVAKDKQVFKGNTNDMSHAMKLGDLNDEGTLRKLRIIQVDEGAPRESWVKQEYVGPKRSDRRQVITAHMIIWSVGGEELFNSRSDLILPETEEDRRKHSDLMKNVALLDDEAGKQPRVPEDFETRKERNPMRWYTGDPLMYTGFDLAAQNLRIGERALFEIDQPLLEPSVRDFYVAKDTCSTSDAGLPLLIHHVNEKKLKILKKELKEWELNLEEKEQRSVRVDLELVSVDEYYDLGHDGEKVISVLDPGLEDGKTVHRQARVLGAFWVARPIDGHSYLESGELVEWTLGEDEGIEGPVGVGWVRDTPWIPKCVADAIFDVDWVKLREGCCIESRLLHGPTLEEVHPETARRYTPELRNVKRPPCSVTVMIDKVLDVKTIKMPRPAFASQVPPELMLEYEQLRGPESEWARPDKYVKRNKEEAEAAKAKAAAAKAKAEEESI
eukprot:gnl/MRDRNA2_/MRDRNA2_114679_c0_seq1.p1 gnl/MRDRNA2_/MRDRNA2_114679_c0~~gnl/MRDRNA2_/MRDRNA2_114679_c0_seq1.p1  ORF type:complete len:661 (+),score=154.60 gnl/MRDRNA2_/MRDRNA2_114679_c0_seq1:152-2134(+)